MPLFVMCAITGTCFLFVGVELLRRLRRLHRIMRDAALEDAPTPRQVVHTISASAPSGSAPSSGGSAETPGVSSLWSLREDSHLAGAASVGAQSLTSRASLRGQYPSMPSQSSDLGFRNSLAQRGMSPVSRESMGSLLSARMPPPSSCPSTVMPSEAQQQAAANVAPIISMVRRILTIVSVCMCSFLYRACIIFYIIQQGGMKWPAGLLLPYYIFSEVIPLVLLLLLYLLPGLEAIWFGCFARKRSVVLSVIEGQRSTLVSPGASCLGSDSPTLRISVVGNNSGSRFMLPNFGAGNNTPTEAQMA